MDWKDACLPNNSASSGSAAHCNDANSAAPPSSLAPIRAIDPPPIESAPNAQENPQHFGRNIRLAMACMDAAQRRQRVKAIKAAHDKISSSDSIPASIQPTPSSQKNVKQLRSELYNVSAELDSQRAELVDLLLQFDEQEGWVNSGAKSCADWASANLGIAASTAYSLLQVGKALRELPLIRSLFRGGELSWSKVKLMTKVADVNTERDLAHACLDATVKDVERICRGHEWALEEEEDGTGRSPDDLAAESQFNNRSLTWAEQKDGSTVLRICLPPEKAQAVLKSLEHCANELYDANDANDDSEVKPTATQRRADAMVAMAERSLQQAGTDISRSDRYQVILHVENGMAQKQPAIQQRFPPKKPWIEGAGPIAHSAARRISCDSTVVGMLLNDGEPLSVGRKTRTWPTAIRRAIVARDRHCQFPGCSEHRYLDVHHIKHWADGGETSVDNGLCLCQRHHTLVHEGGYRVERNFIATNDQPGKNYGLTVGFVSPAKKALLPTRHRFRFIAPSKPYKESTDCECNESPALYQVNVFSQSGLDFNSVIIYAASVTTSSISPGPKPRFIKPYCNNFNTSASLRRDGVHKQP